MLFVKLDRYSPGKKIYNYILSLILFSLALFSKETAITLPAIVVLYDCFFSYKENFKKEFSDRFLKNYLGYFVVLLFYIVIWFYFSGVNRISGLEYIGGNFKPQDDIESLRLFNMDNINFDEIVPEHGKMLKDALAYVNKNMEKKLR